MIVCTLIFSAVLAVPNAHAQLKFKDVNDKFWAVKEIQFLTEKKVIQGYPDGKFRPNNNLTRMQIALMVTRAKNYSLTNRPDPQLKDIKNNEPNYAVVSAVMAEGIFKDVVKNGEFKPNTFVTRAEMASILSRAYNLKGESFDNFSDVTEKHWAYPHIQALVKNQIVFGYDDRTFKPNNLLTRAQFAVMMARMLDESFRLRVYPDGWVAPVLKSSWSPNHETNLKTLQNELGFKNGGMTYGVTGRSEAIHVIEESPSSPYEVSIVFYMWQDSMIPESYRIPVVAKELFKLYFGNDATRVWNYLNKGEIPDHFTANGRKVDVLVSQYEGSLLLQVGRK